MLNILLIFKQTQIIYGLGRNLHTIFFFLLMYINFYMRLKLGFCGWLLWVMGFPGGMAAKNLPAYAGDAGDVSSIPGWAGSPWGGHGNPLQHSSWRSPWTEEPGGLQSLGSQRVGHWMTEHVCMPCGLCRDLGFDCFYTIEIHGSKALRSMS